MLAVGCFLVFTLFNRLFLPAENVNETAQVWRSRSSGELVPTRLLDSSRPRGSRSFSVCEICLAGDAAPSQLSDAVTVGTTWNCIARACHVYDIEHDSVADRPSLSTDSTKHVDDRSTTSTHGWVDSLAERDRASCE